MTKVDTEHFAVNLIEDVAKDLNISDPKRIKQMEQNAIKTADTNYDTEMAQENQDNHSRYVSRGLYMHAIQALSNLERLYHALLPKNKELCIIIINVIVFQ